LHHNRLSRKDIGIRRWTRVACIVFSIQEDIGVNMNDKKINI